MILFVRFDRRSGLAAEGRKFRNDTRSARHKLFRGPGRSMKMSDPEAALCIVSDKSVG